jgi:hypothetical protein
LYNAILQKIPNAKFVIREPYFDKKTNTIKEQEYAQLCSQNGETIDINLNFTKHFIPKNEDLNEYVEFIVSVGDQNFSEYYQEIYRKRIEIDETHFYNLVNCKSENYENIKLKKIVEEEFPEL